jgi:hypothetical protein
VSTSCNTCSTGVMISGCAASSARSGIGTGSIHRRTGTGDDVIDQVHRGLRHAPRAA